LIYDPQYPKALTEDLPKPQNEISKVTTEEERCVYLWRYRLCFVFETRPEEKQSFCW